MKQQEDNKYLDILLNRILVCKQYKPAFGQGKPVSLPEFRQLYGADPFYTWFGLDHPLVYAAHSTAGGITSVYRQIGLGCEELFRQIIQDSIGLSKSQTTWSYTTTTSGGRTRKLSLDARIQLTDITLDSKHKTTRQWLNEAATRIEIAPDIIKALQGIVFEVRQGYKSKDSKRQNADIANAATAYSQGYFPVLLVLSTQIDGGIVERYEHAKWLILQGHLGTSSLYSTYTFTREIIGYDLAGFFQRNKTTLQSTIADILQTLLGGNFANG